MAPPQTILVDGCSVLTGSSSSVMEAWLWNLLNVGVALVGYHAAALSIDWKWWGRVRMQVRLCHANRLQEKHVQISWQSLCSKV